MTNPFASSVRQTKRRHAWSSDAAPRECTRCGVRQHLRRRETNYAKRGFTMDVWTTWPSGASKRTARGGARSQRKLSDVGGCRAPIVDHPRPLRLVPPYQPISIQVQQALDMIRKTGCTCTAAAKAFGVDPAGVARQARKVGLTVRRGRPPKNTKGPTT